MNSSARLEPTRLARTLAGTSAMPLARGVESALIAVVVATFFTQGDLWLNRHGKMPLPPTLLYPLLVVPLVAVAWVRHPRRALDATLRIASHQQTVLFAFASAAAISLLWSVAPGADWSGGGKNVFLESYGFACFVLAMALGAHDLARRDVRAHVGFAFAVLIATIGYDLVAPGTFAEHHSRAAGLGSDPNISATMLVIACALLVDPMRPVKRDLIPLGLTTGAIFVTLSRTGVVLFAILLAWLAFGAWLRAPSARVRRRLAGALVVLAVGTLLAGATVRELAEREIGMFAQPATRNRVLMLTGGESGPGFFDAHEDQRVGLLLTHLGLVAERPWLGHGTAFSKRQPRGAHNRYVRQWTDEGVPGVVAFVALLGFGFVTARRAGDPGLALVWVLVAAAAFVDNLILDNRGVLMALGLRSGATALRGSAP